ncbi:hypothetical protein BCF46_0959 [Litoreibacter meonggei]|uniref:Uncharacterized protein n=1 Tax=Litoreibacter meonggei TaxID=1049199 RepID=A0A497X793_9RHOB|nr:hypothetical protein [Litoreibacter meonggei]RLJ60753.1 hypothetical protein BCF46_0959 [Litoreibacter meonggei]
MKVTINHVQKSSGIIRKTTYHGVAVRVQFNAEELAVIRERQLEKDVLLERGYPSDMSDNAINKHANRSLGKKLLTAAVSGADSLHFDLTVTKLMKGEDVYFLGNPMEAKGYEEELRNGLVRLKQWIVGNAEVEKETASFEL